MEKEKIELVLERFYHFESTRAKEVYLRQPLDGKWIDMTWEEVAKEVRILTAKIKAMNLPEKSCIALMSKNCAHWLIADIAILMSGHISVPLYPTLQADTIEYILEHCDAKLVFIGKLDEWEKQKSGVSDKYPKVSFPMWHNSGTQSWKEFVGNTEPIKENYHPKPDELATIIYTSGTTGKPKGVVHTFESMCVQIHHALKIFNLNSEDRFFSYLPLSHVAERILIELGSIYGGGTVSFAESLDTFAENLRETRPTLFLAVPRIWLKFQQGILQKIPQKKLNILLKIPVLNNIIRKKILVGLGIEQARYCFSGAASIAQELLEWFDKIGVTILDVYGMTENFAITSLNPPGKARFGTAGIPFGENEVKLDPQGQILSRSRANMVGYFKMPEETAKAIDSEGFLHTGDKGKFSSDGYLTITGRVKDLFKTSKGKYVAPNAIESHFVISDLVEQVCVVGDGLPQPLGLIVLSENAKKLSKDSVTGQLNELLKEVNRRVENFERLQNIVVVGDEWSVETGILTPTMKIKRNIVEEKYNPHVSVWSQSKLTVIYHA